MGIHVWFWNQTGSAEPVFALQENVSCKVKSPMGRTGKLALNVHLADVKFVGNGAVSFGR
ncbi:MAG: hypothetical protein ACLT3H_03295 [Roseburia sp.]